jgi:hypothetical protein
MPLVGLCLGFTLEKAMEKGCEEDMEGYGLAVALGKEDERAENEIGTKAFQNEVE